MRVILRGVDGGNAEGELIRGSAIQYARHTSACQTGVGLQRQALACVSIHHAQDPPEGDRRYVSQRLCL